MDDKVNSAALMTCLLLAAGGFLAVAAARRQAWLAVFSATGTLTLFGLWFARYGPEWPYLATCAFGWGLFGLFLAYATGASAWGRAIQEIGIALLGVSGSALVLLWLALPHEPPARLLGQLLVLEAVTLIACLWRRWAWQRWHWIRLAAMVWALVGLLAVVEVGHQPELFCCGWIWAFYALFTADVLLRAWWRASGTVEALDAGLASAATALMFAATYALLNARYRDWMGPYAFFLAAATLALAAALRRLAGRRVLGYAYLGQGLVLLTLACAIQYGKANVLSWLPAVRPCGQIVFALELPYDPTQPA